MTAPLDRLKTLFQPDYLSPKIENMALDPHDKLRSFKILKTEPLSHLDHKTKNTLRFIIELYGSLIPHTFVFGKVALGANEIPLIYFKDNENRPDQKSYVFDWINMDLVKGRDKIKLCLVVESATHKAVWIITEIMLESFSRL